jgi:hypothetical protein
MFARQPKFVLTLLAAYILTLSIASAQTSKKSAHKRAVKQEQPAPAPEPPPPPPPPPTLEQMPASAPQVFFRNGQLTIVARNSTLGDILRAVHTQTGASVDVPSNATERVVSNLGPGPARDVLASLLNGSHFNYVMLGSPNDPHMVQRIILTSKAGAAPENASSENASSENASSNPSQVATQQVYPQQPVPPPDTDEMPVEEVQDEAAPEVDQAEQPGQPEEQQVPNGQQQVKTPEQLLQELQRQQQQQQQGAPQGFPQNQPQPQPQPQPQQNPPQ